MAKINIPFNDKEYSVDESVLSAATAELKTHLSTVMNGTGSVINLGGVPYIDSTKLTAATNAFVSHLGTVAGNGHKVVVNGVEYNIDSAKMAGAIADLHNVLGGLQSGDGGNSGSVTYKEVFADNSWSDIVVACQNNEVPDTWAVGDTKAMTIDGVEYNVMIIGKNHDTYTDGGTAPLTFQLVKCYGTKAKMNSANSNKTGWSNSEMRTVTLENILSAMDSTISGAIKAVNKTTLKGDKSGLETTSDQLFLLSEYEVFGTTTQSNGKQEGLAQYQYYANDGSIVKTFDGTSCNWWLRSPYYGNSINFSCVYSFGFISSNNANISNGVAFGFCF